MWKTFGVHKVPLKTSGAITGNGLLGLRMGLKYISQAYKLFIPAVIAEPLVASNNMLEQPG